ncbi:MAG: SEC-C domain-containing protein [Candidatus Omnitrophica bacterium]|nr:SEC-C domain-containing protein [Candidatus Omnitrophota bacterium]
MPPTRNGPCPCGSGYKFKRCCANRKAKNPESTLLLEAESSSRPRKKAVSLILSLVLLLAAGAAYHHTLQVPFLFDDAFSIVNNRRIHQLWPLWQLLGATNRPFVDLTFALNYAISGLNVASYHAVNIAIHLIAGLFLFGLLRRTCKRFWISFSVALLWLLHPLHTQSITYLSQRAESLMGLCFLAMLYAIARGTTANPFKAVWILAAIGFCALGMLTKPVMVIAPIVALLYDRTFFAGSFSAAWKKRPWLYIGLATTWLLLLPGILRPFPAMEDITVGWHIPGLKPLSYLFSQPAVIWHYLRLAFWPTSLCFDYQWPLSESMEAILIPSLGLGLLALMTIVAWRIFKPIGFLGIWFFLTLAPSSSFIPVADLAAEHRMYLALSGNLVFPDLGTQFQLHPCSRSCRRASDVLSTDWSGNGSSRSSHLGAGSLQRLKSKETGIRSGIADRSSSPLRDADMASQRRLSYRALALDGYAQETPS